MRSFLAGALLLLVPSTLLPAVAAPAGGCRMVAVTRSVDGGTETVLVEVCDGTTTDGTGDAAVQPAAVIPSSLGEGLCRVRAQLLGADPDPFCEEEAQSPPTVTSDLVAQALYRLPFPAAVLQVQPPNGRTMVNFDTNFYTDREPFTRTVTLLGQQVQLRIFPAQFTWHFDDGQPRTTTSPGAPYPDLQITHRYLRAGGYTPRVDTTYAADWRVGTGPWQRVPGTVTIDGEPVALDAVEVRPTLVASS